MTDSENPYYVAYQREKKARQEIEQLLEDSTRQLYEKNLLLQQQIDLIKQQQQSIIQQEKLASLGTVAAGVAHEINNPLAYILSNVNSLTNYAQDLLASIEGGDRLQIDQAKLQFIKEDLPELASDTCQGLMRIKDIVNHLLFFARTDSTGKSVIQLADALDFTLKLLRPMFNNVLVKKEISNVPMILFNVGELNQVLMNIIVNAYQACDVVSDRPSEIQLKLTQSDTNICLTVVDNGCGMDEHTLGRMFDAFYTTKPVGTGTGVGMSIVLQILRQHDCTIDVISELGKGTAIKIFFPIDSQAISMPSSTNL
ncbi:sensor histidine kinase [Shewanella septentrionalis]|uniref:histidine kinase n=1 Tax=Shewanella septentrionalis TaxID=2952223 RepID=A0A9X2WZR5_9GAMM|nr:ATP-binding protein [Shewanella septentrionalis]MCT7948119.1 ATP-binding protein [Shewanella septentrionalis]